MHSRAAMARLHARSPRARNGQSLVETAITLPVVLLLALGVTDIGRAFYYREAVANSVRQALRVAVSPGQQATSGGAISTIANEAALESSTNGTPAGSVIAGATLSVTFHCLNSAAITNATANGSGPQSAGSDSITATISDTMRIITPLLWPVVGAQIGITVSSYQRSEY